MPTNDAALPKLNEDENNKSRHILPNSNAKAVQSSEEFGPETFVSDPKTIVSGTETIVSDPEMTVSDAKTIVSGTKTIVSGI